MTPTIDHIIGNSVMDVVIAKAPSRGRPKREIPFGDEEKERAREIHKRNDEQHDGNRTAQTK